MRSRLIEAFKADRLLCGLAAAMAVATLFPIFLTPFLPLVDLGSNIGAAGLIDDLIRGVQPVSDGYRINFTVLPYWTGYAIMAALEVVGGALFAVKATVALVLLLLPLGVMRLMLALGRSPRLGLWAFLLTWDVNLYWGWFTFQLGMALAIWAIAWLVEAKTTVEFARIIPLIAVVALTHVHAVALLGLVGGSIAWTKRQPLRATLHHALALCGLLVLLPYVVPRLFGGGGLTASFSPVTEKVGSLYRVSLDTLPAGAELTVIAFLLIVFGPAVLATLDRLETPERTGAMAATFLLGATLLYFALPMSTGGAVAHWWTYPRYATYILVGLLLLPSPCLAGRRVWALAPGLAVVVALNVERSAQFFEFGKVTRPYLQIIEALPRNSTFLPLDYEFAWAGTREWPLGQLHGYTAAARSSVDPHLFDQPYSPVLFRSENRLPAPDFGALDASFSMDAHGQYYDYLITYPNARDRVAQLPPTDVWLMKEAGQWRLYKVLRKAAPK